MKITAVMFLLWITLFAGPAPIWASLGQTTASVAADQRQMSGELRSTDVDGTFNGVVELSQLAYESPAA